MSKQLKALKENRELLEMYTKALTKVHAKEHPEVLRVRELYEAIQIKVEEDDIDFSKEFEGLKIVTENYHIPDDVCETYQKTYEILLSISKL